MLVAAFKARNQRQPHPTGGRAGAGPEPVEVCMHIPSVSPELAESVRAKGAISDQEFGGLILHWFPAAWTLCFTLKRQTHPKKPVSDKREEDETVPVRLLNALRHKSEHSVPRPAEPQMKRVLVPEMVGIKAVSQVYEVMASDAMHRCAETVHEGKFRLESEESLLMIPDGLRAPPLELPALSLIEERYHLACDQIRIVLADMEDSAQGFGRLDCSRAPRSLEQLVTLMAIQPYRMRIEREYGIELAYQWPGILAAAPSGSRGRLREFRSAAEQILAIHRNPKNSI